MTDWELIRLLHRRGDQLVWTVEQFLQHDQVEGMYERQVGVENAIRRWRELVKPFVEDGSLPQSH